MPEQIKEAATSPDVFERNSDRPQPPQEWNLLALAGPDDRETAAFNTNDGRDNAVNAMLQKDNSEAASRLSGAFDQGSLLYSQLNTPPGKDAVRAWDAAMAKAHREGGDAGIDDLVERTNAKLAQTGKYQLEEIMQPKTKQEQEALNHIGNGKIFRLVDKAHEDKTVQLIGFKPDPYNQEQSAKSLADFVKDGKLSAAELRDMDNILSAAYQQGPKEIQAVVEKANKQLEGIQIKVTDGTAAEHLLHGDAFHVALRKAGTNKTISERPWYPNPVLMQGHDK